MKKRLGLLISFSISIVFLFLALKKVDVKEIGESLMNVNLFYFFLTVLITFIAFFLRAVRWKVLLSPVKSFPLVVVFNATMIGFMCNYTLPARVGEVIRAYLVGTRGRISKSAAFATIIVERVMDLFTLLLFAAVILIFFPVPLFLKRIGVTIFILNILVFLFLVIIQRKSVLFIKIIEKPLSIFGKRIKERITVLLSSFIEGLDILGNPASFLMASFISFCIWVVTGLHFYVLFFSLPIRLPLYAAFLDMVILTFGIMIPSTSGFIGTFQFFVKEGLMIFNVDPNIALSYSILLYATQFLLVVGVGLISLWFWGLDFKYLKTKASSYNLSGKK